MLPRTDIIPGLVFGGQVKVKSSIALKIEVCKFVINHDLGTHKQKLHVKHPDDMLTMKDIAELVEQFDAKTGDGNGQKETEDKKPYHESIHE